MTGKKNVEEARQFYSEAVTEKKHPEYMKGLQFEVASTAQGDPDQEMMASR